MKKWIWLAAAVIVVGAATLSHARVYRVAGSSDAPTYLMGDRILVNKAAYDLHLPFTDIVVVSHSWPRAGDVIMYRPPDEEYPVFKRVIGCPGDVVAMRENRLEINGSPLQYEPVDGADFGSIAEINNLGSMIERESGGGREHLVTHTPGASPYASFDPVQVPEGRYFVIGDNRDHSLDSRMYGPIPRSAILGMVVCSF